MLIELIYLLSTGLIQFIGQQAGYELRLISPLTQLLLLPFQISVLVIMLIRWSNETFEIQDKELIIREGVLKRIEKSYPYNNMQSVIVRQSLFERAVGAGTISVFVPTLGKDLLFSEIPNPKQFARILKQAIPYSDKNQFVMRK